MILSSAIRASAINTSIKVKPCWFIGACFMAAPTASRLARRVPDLGPGEHAQLPGENCHWRWSETAARTPEPTALAGRVRSCGRVRERCAAGVALRVCFQLLAVQGCVLAWTASHWR